MWRPPNGRHELAAAWKADGAIRGTFPSRATPTTTGYTHTHSSGCLACVFSQHIFFNACSILYYTLRADVLPRDPRPPHFLCHIRTVCTPHHRIRVFVRSSVHVVRPRVVRVSHSKRACRVYDRVGVRHIRSPSDLDLGNGLGSRKRRTEPRVLARTQHAVVANEQPHCGKRHESYVAAYSVAPTPRPGTDSESRTESHPESVPGTHSDAESHPESVPGAHSDAESHSDAKPRGRIKRVASSPSRPPIDETRWGKRIARTGSPSVRVEYHPPLAIRMDAVDGWSVSDRTVHPPDSIPVGVVWCGSKRRKKYHLLETGRFVSRTWVGVRKHT